MIFPPKKVYKKMLTEASGKTEMRKQVAEVMEDFEVTNRDCAHFALDTFMQGGHTYEHNLHESVFSMAELAINDQPKTAQGRLIAKLGKLLQMLTGQLFADLCIEYAKKVKSKHKSFRLILDSDCYEVRPTETSEEPEESDYITRQELLAFFQSEN